MPPDPPPARRVLIVDDDLDFAGSIARLLELEGCSVVVAYDGRGAVGRVDEADVALVDIRLGHEDGVRLVGELRRLRPELLVVMVTAYASVQTAIRALQAGAYDYVCKPFEPEDLMATLDRCFDRLRLARERADVEDQLRHSRRMDAIGQLAAGIAHDFNNLLAVVVGSLRLAQDEAGRATERSVEVLQDLLADALNAAQEGVKVNRRLLAVGRAQPLLPTRLELGEAMTGARRLLQSALGEAITLELRPPAEACHVCVDAQQFEISLLNLALNARDAVIGSGRVQMTVAPELLNPGSALLVEDMAPGRYVRVTIEDDGQGMTAEVAERALHPFFSTKPPDRGSGLGLSTVYGFVRQSGGNMTIESRPGEGAVISLLLPALEASGGYDQPSASSAVKT